MSSVDLMFVNLSPLQNYGNINMKMIIITFLRLSQAL